MIVAPLIFGLAGMFAVLRLYRRTVLGALLFGLLVVYTLFSQVGYIAFPQRALALRLFYGEDAFWPYFAFVVSSLVFVFLGLWWSSRGGDSIGESGCLPASSLSRLVVLYLVIGAYLAAFGSLTVVNYSELSYAFAELPSTGYALLFSTGPTIALLLMVRCLSPSRHLPSRLIDAMLLMACLGEMGVVIVRTGSRSQLASVGLAVLAYTLFRFRRRALGVIAVLVPLVAAVMIVGLALEDARSRFVTVGLGDLWSSVTNLSVLAEAGGLELVVNQDYYAPSLLLLGSIAQDIVIPSEVLISNVANSLVFIGHPYLSETVGGYFTMATRTQGYAYYLLCEGYNALGWFGPLYNGLALTLGFRLWRALTRGPDNESAAFLVGVASAHLIGLVRGQTAYFLKDAYLYILPAMVLYYFSAGVPLWPRRPRASR